MNKLEKPILPKNVKIYQNESGDLYLVNTWTGRVKVFELKDSYTAKNLGTKYINDKNITNSDGDECLWLGAEEYFGWWNGFKKVKFENDLEFYDEVQK